MSLNDKIKNQNRIETEILKNLSDFSYKSLKGRREKGRNFKNDIVNLGQLPFLETPPPNKITKDMIEDYQKSLLEPLRDENGVMINEKYRPSSFAYEIADIQAPYTPIDDTHLGKPAEQDDINTYKELNALIDDLRKYEEQHKDLYIEYREKRKTLNDGSSMSPTSRTALSSQILQLRKDMTALSKDIETIQNEITNKEIQIKDAKENIRLNKIGEQQHVKAIKDNLEKYRQSIIDANRLKGLYVEGKLPNETDEDYLTRMKDIEAEQFDVVLWQGKAELHQVQKPKQNL
jgi:hypothetical protein